MGVDLYNGTVDDVPPTCQSASATDCTHIPSVMETDIQQATVRRLLPIECERLMGFPDNHTQIEWNGKTAEDCPDAPRYKACGNSFCVNVMEWIGRRIEEIERKYNDNH